MDNKVKELLKSCMEEKALIEQEIQKHKSHINFLMAQGNALIGKIEVLELLNNKEENKDE